MKPYFLLQTLLIRHTVGFLGEGAKKLKMLFFLDNKTIKVPDFQKKIEVEENLMFS